MRQDSFIYESTFDKRFHHGAINPGTDKTFNQHDWPMVTEEGILLFNFDELITSRIDYLLDQSFNTSNLSRPSSTNHNR